MSQLTPHPRQFEVELVTAHLCLRNGGLCSPHGVLVSTRSQVGSVSRPQKQQVGRQV
jgi:hypothetical protein